MWWHQCSTVWVSRLYFTPEHRTPRKPALLSHPVVLSCHCDTGLYNLAWTSCQSPLPLLPRCTQSVMKESAGCWCCSTGGSAALRWVSQQDSGSTCCYLAGEQGSCSDMQIWEGKKPSIHCFWGAKPLWKRLGIAEMTPKEDMLPRCGCFELIPLISTHVSRTVHYDVCSMFYNLLLLRSSLCCHSQFIQCALSLLGARVWGRVHSGRRLSLLVYCNLILMLVLKV